MRMRYYTICLFGHRTINDLEIIEKKLRYVISEVLKKCDSLEVMIGRNGEFDEFSASVIKQIQKESNVNINLVLVLPYNISQIEDLDKYYDGIIIPEILSQVHPKGAIKSRNQYMINRSELVIVYVKEKGGAFTSLQYAKKTLKCCINLADDNLFNN